MFYILKKDYEGFSPKKLNINFFKLDEFLCTFGKNMEGHQYFLELLVYRKVTPEHQSVNIDWQRLRVRQVVKVPHYHPITSPIPLIVSLPL